jgi:hypothetical protein
LSIAAAACLALAITRATSITGTISVQMVGTTPARHPIVVRTHPGIGLRGRSSVPVKTRMPPPTSVPNQKTRPPSPLRTSRTVSAIPAATSKQPRKSPNHHVQPRTCPQYPFRPVAPGRLLRRAGARCPRPCACPPHVAASATAMRRSTLVHCVCHGTRRRPHDDAEVVPASPRCRARPEPAVTPRPPRLGLSP